MMFLIGFAAGAAMVIWIDFVLSRWLDNEENDRGD